MTTLVTGADGFVGRHFLAAEPGVPLALRGVLVDLRDAAAVREAVGIIAPDRVVHLAAQSFVPQSFAAPEETFDVNIGGTLNLLVALKACGFHGRFLYVSSGDVYGHVPERELPVSETRLPRPRNPYAASKVGAEALCYQWGLSEGMDAVVARPFNHIGPGQRPNFVLSDIARQLASSGSGKAPLTLGDVDVTRDYCDVGDIVEAYRLLLDKGVSGETYNVCSGQERSVRDCARQMAALLGREVVIRTDASRLRPAEQRRMAGDPRKIQALGWRPCIPWEETLRRLLDFWKSSDRS